MNQPGTLGPRQPNHEPRLQKFFQFVEGKSQPGVCGNESGIAVFLPESDLKDYFADDDRLRGILKLLFENQTPFPIRFTQIRNRYLKVFAILLCAEAGNWITHFEHYDSLSDEKLPFYQPPENFPPEIGAPGLFKEFQERQWRFCAPKLNFARSKVWKPLRVLPIISKEPLGAGGSAATFKVVVHPEYDNLDTKRNSKKDSNRDSNTYVLKQYNTSDAEAECAKEDGAFERLNTMHHRVRSGITGNRESAIIGFYGSFEQGGKHNVILEYANGGTLEDYFKRNSPPSTAQGIYLFWEALLKLGRALTAIHNQTIDSRVHHGWHQDVKPQNILVSTRSGLLEFKLADLGLSHFQPQSGADAYGRDARGTRTYGAPECYIHESDMASGPFQVTPKVDIWSLGCILSEAAIWLVHGRDGLNAYRELRRQALEEIDVSDSDCFHNGEEALPCVIKTLSPQHLLENGRRNDTLTGTVLGIIEDALLPAEYRADAKQLWNKAQRALKACEYMNVGPALSTSFQSPIHLLSPPQNGSALRMQESSTLQNSPRIFTLPTEQEPNGGAVHQKPPFPKPSGRALRSASSSGIFNDLSPQPVGSFITGSLMESPVDSDIEYIPEVEAQPIPLGASPGRRHATKNNKPRLSPQRRSSAPDTSQVLTPGVSTAQAAGSEETIRSHSSGQSDSSTSRHTRREKGKERQMSVLSDIQSTSAWGMQDNRSSQLPDRNYSIELGVSTNRINVLDQRTNALPASQAGRRRPPIPSMSNFRVDKSPSGNHENKVQAYSSKRRPELPLLSVEAAKDWRAQRKKESKFFNRHLGSSRVPLQDDHWMSQLHNRDHVFLIDDASSMRNHWDDVISLIDVLAYIVKSTDDDGVDLYFTICKALRRDEKKTKDLIQFAKDHRPDPQKPRSERLTNMDHSLASILHQYRERLEKDYQRVRSEESSWFSRVPRPVRKLNLYVLTDGLWQPESNGVKPIKALISTLESLKSQDDQVGIQFIQFGDEEEGTKCLSYLDNGLVKNENFEMDIVDTEPFTGGNVWKMLLGAINPWFDGSDLPTAPGSESATLEDPSLAVPRTPRR
ncbi:hypothetical protein AOQ84DRAFT_67856, partial [Glonium stellatum]